MNRNITINVPADAYAAFETLCSVSGCSKNEYGNALIAYALEYRLIASDNDEELAARQEAIAAGRNPLPKVSKVIKAGAPAKLGGEKLPMAAEEPTTSYGGKKKGLLKRAGESLERAGQKNLESGQQDLRRSSPAEGEGNEQPA
jgi:hypothetical protein